MDIITIMGKGDSASSLLSHCILISACLHILVGLQHVEQRVNELDVFCSFNVDRVSLSNVCVLSSDSLIDLGSEGLVAKLDLEEVCNSPGENVEGHAGSA